MNHTPGPWRVAGGGSNAILAPSPSEKPDRYVQVIYSDGDSYFYQSRGDASLIAAAPDLLAALKKLSASHLATIEGEGFDPEHCVCSDLDDAFAAIRKAEGAITTSQRAEK